MKQNGQVFTPDYYVHELLDKVSYEGEVILGKKFLENSCGDGRIICEAVTRYIHAASKEGYSKIQIATDLERNFIGYELDELAYDSCLKNLRMLAIKFDLGDINWNIKKEDFLTSVFEFKIDYIVGNPPYIMYKHLSDTNRKYLKIHFKSCENGQFDYCYAFIEKSIDILNEKTGRMSYLIPSSIFKNKFGKNLRKIMLPYLKSINDYKNIKIFPKILVSASIICIDKLLYNKNLSYYDVKNNKRIELNKSSLDNEKWIFELNSVKEHDHITLAHICKISNSVATLLNEAFIIKKFVDIDEYFVSVDGLLIEKKLLRDAYSARSIKYNLREKIIFPYEYGETGIIRYEKDVFKRLYPFGYKYLMQWRNELEMRSKEKNAEWFEFGRSQALQSINKPKLLISSVVTNKINIYKLSKDAVPYSGFFIVPNDPFTIDDIEKIINTPEFLNYLIIRGISISGKSLRFSVNDFRNFPLYLLGDKMNDIINRDDIYI